MTSQITGQSFGASISPSEWKHLADTGPGAAALVRLVFTVACVWVAMRPERLIDTSTHLAALAIPAVAVASMGFDRARRRPPGARGGRRRRPRARRWPCGSAAWC